MLMLLLIYFVHTNSFYWARQPPKLPPLWVSGRTSNTWFFGPWATQVTHPDGLSICSSVFAGLTNVAGTRIDHATLSLASGVCCDVP